MMKPFRTFAMRLLVMTTAFIGIISVVLTLVMTHQYSNTLMRQTESTTLSAFEASAGQIDKLLSDARTVSVHAMQNNAVHGFLRDSFPSDAAYIEARRDMIGAIRDYFVRYWYLNGLMIISRDGTAIGASLDWTFVSPEPTPLAKAIVDKIASTEPGHISWLGAYRTRDFYTPIDSRLSIAILEQPMICAIEPWNFASADHTETLYVLFSVSKAAVDAALSQLDDSDGIVSLVNREGMLITGGAPERLGETEPYALAINPDSAAGTMEIMLDGGRTQLIYTRLPITGWLLTKRVPLASYRALTDSLRRTSVLTCLLVLSIVCVLYGIWATRFMRPLKHITRVLRAIERGMDGRMDIKSGVLEFELIAGRFNAMMDSMTEMHRREIATQRELLVLEIRNLQSQINPHFLYNSITSIRWLATFLGADRVSDMLIELSEILRPVFSEWQLDWRIRDELQFIEHYMELMRLRYGAGFTVSGRLPEELLDAYIPRFTLQPLLENACEHGMNESGRMEIRLSASLSGEDAVLSVRDNGQGMNPETLARVRAALSAGRPESGNGSIGLCNVHQRIQLYYGAGYGLTIESGVGEGVRIDVRIKVVAERSVLLDEAPHFGGGSGKPHKL